jgi:chromosome segregation ATPase
VRCKSLQRDLLRLQLHVSNSSEALASSALERQGLEEEFASFRIERVGLLSQVRELTSRADAAERMHEREAPLIEQLSFQNEELRRQVEMLQAQCQRDRDLAHVKETQTTATNTETSHELSPPPPPALLPPPGADKSTATSRISSQEVLRPNENRVDMLEANIARLTRLADALLNRDD